MYSIKWFKDNAELYRYIPTNQPQYKSFQTPGALVDETLSKPNMLMLRITLKTSIFLGVLHMIASIAATLLIGGTSCINM